MPSTTSALARNSAGRRPTIRPTSRRCSGPGSTAGYHARAMGARRPAASSAVAGRSHLHVDAQAGAHADGESPVHYRRRDEHGDRDAAAQRNLFNRTVGNMFHRLHRRDLSDENTASPTTLAATARRLGIVRCLPRPRRLPGHPPPRAEASSGPLTRRYDAAGSAEVNRLVRWKLSSRHARAASRTPVATERGPLSGDPCPVSPNDKSRVSFSQAVQACPALP